MQNIIESYNVDEAFMYEKTYLFIKGFAVGRHLNNTLKMLPIARKIHNGQYLKILPEYFNEVQSHNKQFELRKDDRDYRVGDWILLKEFENGSYTGRECGCFSITYILRNCPEYGLADGYCIIG